MEVFKNILNKVDGYERLFSCIKENKFPLAGVGISDIHKANILLTLCKDFNKKAVLVTASEAEAIKMNEDLQNMGANSCVFNLRDLCFRDMEIVSKEYQHKRIETLARLIRNDFDVLVVPVEASLFYIMPKKELSLRIFDIKIGDLVCMDKICKMLHEIGYEKYDRVDGVGQFSVRGGILDIFSVGHSLPVRIEFFDNQIEKIFEFDTFSQRRVKQIESISIMPASEVLIKDKNELSDKIRKVLSKLKDKNGKAYKMLESELEKISNDMKLSMLDKFINLIYSRKNLVFDYISEDAFYFVLDLPNIKYAVNSLKVKHEEDLKIYLEEGVLLPGFCDYMEDFNYILDLIKNRKTIYMETFLCSEYDINPKCMIDFNASEISPFRGSVEDLVFYLNSVISSGCSVILMAGSEKFAKALCNDLKDAGINSRFSKDAKVVSEKEVLVIEGGISCGFKYEGGSTLVLTYGVYKKKTKKKKKIGTKVLDISDLKEGDYVVHVHHGIGIFSGIHRIKIGPVVKDYIKIMYDKSDVLYVPVAQMDLVSKYIGSKEDVKLKLSSLSSSKWQKTKSRVRSAVRDIAKELIKLYAERINATGFAFSEDNEFQKDFDSRFEYEETSDQIKSINEIKKDMQKKSPMDRLLCGDVGFGKTEVAFRAIFKCLADGKQCAMLVPTTVLAWQHFNTALKRFDGFSFKIELLSRFRTPKQQKEIIEKIKNGDVELVIGTHKLVQKDIVFRDLGLVVIDEEQRFGVAQKEKFKSLAKNVDVLTLSATPIPRTLSMAMSGIRDMSTLSESPQNRFPVQTYVMQYNKYIIFEAIKKEIKRSGQVYYLHNRIDSIENVASEIEFNIPEAKVGIAHGRMLESELSSVWGKLLRKEINVLVCTTIVETGVDVPDANTLIIENADCMGLSQLHQLRGRVGRSSRRAYAYFTFRKDKVLSEIAQKRLSAIKDFTEFGSGFKIAMRDLELRGAGNIIGAQQHGNMEAVGYDMYIKMLEEEIKREKGGDFYPSETDCSIDIDISAYIPDTYVPSLSQRLSMYRRISDIKAKRDVYDVIDEFKDRFGSIPIQTNNLINIAYIRSLARKMDIIEIKQRDRFIFMYILDLKKISSIICRKEENLEIVKASRPYLSLELDENSKAIDALNKVFSVDL